MIDRISKNEERLDNITLSINELKQALYNFKSNKKDINILNKYYGSKNWFKDKELYENEKIPKIKAGVLSEDAVWNILEEVKELINDMKSVIEYYDK